jgi:hypothetical protein
MKVTIDLRGISGLCIFEVHRCEVVYCAKENSFKLGKKCPHYLNMRRGILT